jgi:hypothetical protein
MSNRCVKLVVACVSLLCACARDDSAARDKALYIGIMTDLKTAISDIAAKHDVDLEADPPRDWLTPVYLSSASIRPDVARYFQNYVAYVDELDARYEPVADSIIDDHFRRAVLGASEAELKTAFKRGFQRTLRNQRTMTAAVRRYAESALRLHEYMASVDDRVDPGVGDDLEFKNLGEKMRYASFLLGVERSQEYLAKVQSRNDSAVAAAMKEAGVKASDIR